MRTPIKYCLLAIFLFMIACTCSPAQIINTLKKSSPTPALNQSGQDQAVSTPEAAPQATQINAPEVVVDAPVFSAPVFCQDVTDDGVPVGPTNSFPSGTKEVWAYFTYSNMQDGMTWGRLWMLEDQIWIDSRNDTWADGSSGWLAYSISEDDTNISLNGNYSLQLFIGDTLMQQGGFFVAAPIVSNVNSFPAFGNIQFAEGINEAIVPYGITSEFNEGIGEVFAVWQFVSMQDGQPFRREWLQDGEIIAEKDLLWEEGAQGVDYASLTDEDGLEPGTYTLNLYLDGQIARSANFIVVATNTTVSNEPSVPEDIIDSYMMPAWQNLYYSNISVLSELAQWTLDNHVQVYVDENYDGAAKYTYSCSEPPVVGEVVMSYDYWNSHSWEEVTAALAHELNHAVQHMTGNYRCGCSIEKEYYAWITEFYVLQEMGRMDILSEDYGGTYDEETGEFDGSKLWEALKETYSDCLEY